MYILISARKIPMRYDVQYKFSWVRICQPKERIIMKNEIYFGRKTPLGRKITTAPFRKYTLTPSHSFLAFTLPTTTPSHHKFAYLKRTPSERSVNDFTL